MNNIKTLTASLALLFTFASPANACLTAESESNNSESTANSGLCSATTLSGDLSRNDTDWISFEVNEPGIIDITLDHHRRDDFDWALYQSTGSAVATGSTSSAPETGSYNATQTGTYYLKLTRYKGSGWYDLTATFGSSTPPGGGSCDYGARPSKPGSLKAWISGDSADSCASLSDGAVLLMGGGSDVDAAFSNRVKNHIGEGKDVVVLRTSGTDGYNDYLQGLMAADSVETLLVDSRSKANDAYVEWAIRSAEFVWVAGGDQADYLNQWAGTKVQTAMQHVYDKGGVVGGTSAGMALMADSIYDPDGVSGAVSSEVVTDFCHNTLAFSSRFMNIPMLNKSLTDTHFYERDRMGRALVSLAHHANDHFSIAASEGTSIFITSDGVGVVDGSYEVYVLRETTSTTRDQLSCGQPVIYSNVRRTKLLSGQSYNFNTHSHNGTNLSIGVDGRNTTFYSPSDPY